MKFYEVFKNAIESMEKYRGDTSVKQDVIGIDL